MFKLYRGFRVLNSITHQCKIHQQQLEYIGSHEVIVLTHVYYSLTSLPREVPCRVGRYLMNTHEFKDVYPTSSKTTRRRVYSLE